ncbi:hypothetical protein [Sphingomonas sp.]|uniref:hypothetical protein n=1 Tax=Sphingomonas sp. TaxID=28214 RepID=UPI002ED86741
MRTHIRHHEAAGAFWRWRRHSSVLARDVPHCGGAVTQGCAEIAELFAHDHAHLAQAFWDHFLKLPAVQAVAVKFEAWPRRSVSPAPPARPRKR